jgi:putative transposase
MARPLRESPGGLAYHVLNRGAGRQDLFAKDEDYAAFLRAMDQVQARLAVPVIAFCLMSNHWHLILRPEKDGELSEFMRLLQVTHAQRHHAHHKTAGTGPLYQGRFKSFPFDGKAYAGTVIRYVERNPLRAGLCRRAENWRWGSAFCRYTKGAAMPAWLLPESKWPVRAGEDYRDWLNRPQTAAEEDAMKVCIQRSRPYGSEPWVTKIASKLGLESTLRSRGRPRKTPVKMKKGS